MVSPPNPVVTTSMWRYLPAGVASPGRTQADEARRHRLCFRGRAGITDQGGRFGHCPGSNRDDLNGATCLHELYSRADGNFAGRATVPVLWDNKRKTMVNNEYAEIVRMFNSGFGALADESVDLYPQARRDDIDALTECSTRRSTTAPTGRI